MTIKEDIEKEIDSYTFTEQKQLIDHLGKFLEALYHNYRAKEIASGNCPHDEVRNITTMGDDSEMVTYMCKECSSVLKVPRGGVIK